MQFIIRLAISTLAVFVCSYIIPGVHVESIFTAIVVAVVLAFLNAVVKPIMVILTIPVTIFSFGIFLLVINAAIVLMADKLIDGFSVKSFWTALWFSIVMWLITMLLDNLNKPPQITSANDPEEFNL